MTLRMRTDEPQRGQDGSSRPSCARSAVTGKLPQMLQRKVSVDPLPGAGGMLHRGCGSGGPLRRKRAVAARAADLDVVVFQVGVVALPDLERGHRIGAAVPIGIEGE